MSFSQRKNCHATEKAKIIFLRALLFASIIGSYYVVVFILSCDNVQSIRIIIAVYVYTKSVRRRIKMQILFVVVV